VPHHGKIVSRAATRMGGADWSISCARYQMPVYVSHPDPDRSSPSAPGR